MLIIISNYNELLLVLVNFSVNIIYNNNYIIAIIMLYF